MLSSNSGRSDPILGKITTEKAVGLTQGDSSNNNNNNANKCIARYQQTQPNQRRRQLMAGQHRNVLVNCVQNYFQTTMKGFKIRGKSNAKKVICSRKMEQNNKQVVYQMQLRRMSNLAVAEQQACISVVL